MDGWFSSVARRWEGGDPGVSNQKTPTTILLTPDKKFHSFGYAARDFYHDLDPTESKQWLYLEKFKMKLHTTAVRKLTDVLSIDLYESALGFLVYINITEITDHKYEDIVSFLKYACVIFTGHKFCLAAAVKY